MILTAPYSEVSSTMTNLFFTRVTPIFREHVQKNLNVNDTRFGFYSHLKKKALLGCRMANDGINGLTLEKV